MPNKPCLDCGKPSPSTRCRGCQTPRDRTKKARRPDLNTWAWRRISNDIRRAHIEANGSTCQGWGNQGPHWVSPAQLTVDHVQEVAAGGPTTGPYRVLCRSCNGRKGQASQHQ